MSVSFNFDLKSRQSWKEQNRSRDSLTQFSDGDLKSEEVSNLLDHAARQHGA